MILNDDGMNLEEGIMKRFAPFVAGLGLLGGAARGDEYKFSGDKLVDLGISQKKLGADERMISSVQYSQEFRHYINGIAAKIKSQSGYIKDLHIEMIQEDFEGKKEGVFSIMATIEAPDEQTAKSILISSVMKVAQSHGMGRTAIKGMKQIFVPEGLGGVFRLRMKLYPDFSYNFF